MFPHLHHLLNNPFSISVVSQFLVSMIHLVICPSLSTLGLVVMDRFMRAGSSRLPLSGPPNRFARHQAEVASFLAIAHLRWTEWLRILQSLKHYHRAAKGRVNPGRDGARVSREQLRQSQDPPTHRQGGPIKTYNGCPQPFPSNARSPDAHAMHPGKQNGSCPTMKGQEHLSGNNKYVHALGRICDGDDQPVKNREMRSLTQKGSQAKFFHRMPRIQRAPVVYDLQHLRE